MSDADDADTRDREQTTGNRETTASDRGRWLSAVIALLGIWMVVQAVWFDPGAAQFWNDVVVGVLLLAAGGYNYTRRSEARLGTVGAAGLAALLGLWLLLAPFVLGGDAGATGTATGIAVWNDVVVGLLAILFGAYSAYVARGRRRETAGAMAR
ncbi:SPW repeat domain-containing protein [Haloarchaeobius sp. HRN-SO-5]|uniref:SPW repeat domain-containing protein n=1 Tax=Haloarchaeobius sp. HRN-SO-5 TaxID=3446118 RepID=UPI003EBF13C8